MWAILGFLLVGVILSLLEIPPLLKKKWYREIVVYLLLLLTGLALSALLALNIAIPTPLNLLIKIYRPVTNFIEQILS